MAKLFSTRIAKKWNIYNNSFFSKKYSYYCLEYLLLLKKFSCIKQILLKLSYNILYVKSLRTTELYNKSTSALQQKNSLQP